MKRQRKFIHLTVSLGNTSNRAPDRNFEWSLQPTGSKFFFFCAWLDTSACVEEHTSSSARIEFKCQGSKLGINPTAWLKFKHGDRLSAWIYLVFPHFLLINFMLLSLNGLQIHFSSWFFWFNEPGCFINDSELVMRWPQRSLGSIPGKVTKFFLSFKAFRPALKPT